MTPFINMRCHCPSIVFLFYNLETGGYSYLLLYLNTLRAALNQRPLKIKTRCYYTQTLGRGRYPADAVCVPSLILPSELDCCCLSIFFSLSLSLSIDISIPSWGVKVKVFPLVMIFSLPCCHSLPLSSPTEPGTKYPSWASDRQGGPSQF